MSNDRDVNDVLGQLGDSDHSINQDAVEKLKKLDTGAEPEELEDDVFYEGDGDITGVISEAAVQQEQKKVEEQQQKKERLYKKRQTVNNAKTEAGVRRSKQSKHPTRSHDFLQTPVADRAIHLLMYKSETEIYKDGADFAPRLVLGVPYHGKKSTRNAFEHLISAQEKIAKARGENPKNAPNWIVISNDTSIIMDRNLITRLEELKPTTHAAGSYGFERIRASGKWYQIDHKEEQKYLRGCYSQASLTNTNWDFIVGDKFSKSPKFRVLIVHGPFIAIRGETFMTMDFKDMAENMTKGFHHYMAHISMECMKRGLYAAQIKSLSEQYESISDVKETTDFIADQDYFTSVWQPVLPASIYPNDNFR